MAKKKVKCADCVNYNGTECTHKSNIGIKVKYRNEYTYYIKTPEDLNAQGYCKIYEKV